MEFQRINRTDPERIFVICQNTSGGTLSAGVPVFWETDAQTDGVAVSQASASEQFGLFVGITRNSMIDDAFDLIQTFGLHTQVFVSGASAGNEVGLALIPVAGQDYLTDSTSSARADWNYVNLGETIAAAAGNSAVIAYNCFISST